MPDENKTPEFSVTLVTNDICSCGSCFARNTDSDGRPAVDIYDLRIGNVAMRMCAKCLAGMHASLGAALAGIEAREARKA